MLQSCVHARKAVATASLRAHIEPLFADPPPRAETRLYGKPGQVRRDALWFATPAADGAMPLYRTFPNAYGYPGTTAGVDKAVRPHVMPAWMDAVVRQVLPEGNHVVLHRYLDGCDHISPHRDKWMDIAPGSAIVSVSVGATRDFRIGNETFPVEDGDVVTIPYELNQVMKHAVLPRRRGVDDVRYSLTARVIDTFYDPETKTLVRWRGQRTKQ
jgi:alkylated DNA repair dioxygenase AlkB